MLKTHYCGDLRASEVGQTVTLAGWVHRRRDHGGLIFLDLRDSRGVVQVVVNPDAADAHAVASEARSEYVLRIEGRVERRRAGSENPKLPTGEIEVIAASAEILNAAKTPPFYINEDSEIGDAQRLQDFMGGAEEELFVPGRVDRIRGQLPGRIPGPYAFFRPCVDELRPLAHPDMPAAGLQLVRRTRRRRRDAWSVPTRRCRTAW